MYVISALEYLSYFHFLCVRVFLLYVCKYVCVSICEPPTWRDQRSVLDTQKLQLQTVISCHVVLETKFGSSARKKWMSPFLCLNPSFWEMEVGNSKGQGHPWLCSDFESSLGNVRTCLSFLFVKPKLSLEDYIKPINLSRHLGTIIEWWLKVRISGLESQLDLCSLHQTLHASVFSLLVLGK